MKGYILEEVLAYLIKNTGYQLIVDEKQDPIELKRRGHGLVIVGRGGEHQADVLGQLLWIPTFTYPIRLFVEAKFKNTKVGIDIVRNAIGIVDDLNQNYSPMTDSNRILVKRYSYNFAIFSTSGFTKNATDMAIAHKISLIDLSGEDFLGLKGLISQTANYILTEVGAYSRDTFLNESVSSRGSFIRDLRKFLRLRLGTWPLDDSSRQLSNRQNYIFSKLLGNLLEGIENFGELFVGMANGPFLVILKEKSPGEFRQFAAYEPTHRINISWNDDNGGGRKWTITPNNYKDAYELTFTLSKPLGDFIFQNDNPTKAALDIKERFFSSITIYSYKKSKDEIFRLEYSSKSPKVRKK